MFLRHYRLGRSQVFFLMIFRYISFGFEVCYVPAKTYRKFEDVQILVLCVFRWEGSFECSLVICSWQLLAVLVESHIWCRPEFWLLDGQVILLAQYYLGNFRWHLDAVLQNAWIQLVEISTIKISVADLSSYLEYTRNWIPRWI